MIDDTFAHALSLLVRTEVSSTRVCRLFCRLQHVLLSVADVDVRVFQDAGVR